MDIQTLKTNMAAARAEMRAHGEAAIKVAFQDMFNTCPEISRVVWTQYAPYFNDGDACEFSVHEPEFRTEELDAEDEDYCHGDGDLLGSLTNARDGIYWRTPPVPGRELTPRETELVDAMCGLLGLFCEETEDLFRSVFGEHVIVVATRDGFDVDEYSHD